MGILYHFRVPSLGRNVDASAIVHAGPGYPILGLCVADAITRLKICPVVYSTAVRVPHVIEAVFLKDRSAHDPRFESDL